MITLENLIGSLGRNTREPEHLESSLKGRFLVQSLKLSTERRSLGIVEHHKHGCNAMSRNMVRRRFFLLESHQLHFDDGLEKVVRVVLIRWL